MGGTLAETNRRNETNLVGIMHDSMYMYMYVDLELMLTPFPYISCQSHSCLQVHVVDGSYMYNVLTCTCSNRVVCSTIRLYIVIHVRVLYIVHVYSKCTYIHVHVQVCLYLHVHAGHLENYQGRAKME